MARNGDEGPGRAVVLLVAVCGVCGCTYFGDSGARFGLDQVIFDKVQVVSAFPAFIDPKTNTVTRVCGRSMDPGVAALQPNGVELTVNLVSTDLAVTEPKCQGDRDQGIREGDPVEQRPVLANSADPTLEPKNFELVLGCYEPREGPRNPGSCWTFAGTPAKTPASVLKYKAVTPARCDAANNATWQNVAILVDHSGSTDGRIYTDTGDCTTATTFVEDMPGKHKMPEKASECASDRHRVLTFGATSLIDSLNAQDRVLTMYFDESEAGLRVACTDDLRCQKDEGNGIEITSTPCISALQCAASYHCAADPTLADDTFAALSMSDQMNKCFGKSDQAKAENRLGLELHTSEIASGRAPVYQALATAGTFLRSINASQPIARHIVLLTDGPDTCTYSDLFQFADPKAGKGGACRKPCSMATTDYQALLKVLTDPKLPMRVHVIQMQSKPHPHPDVFLQDIACRTEGTYQFINNLEMDNKGPSALQVAMSSAVAMVRFTLSGNWRVGFLDKHIATGAVQLGAVTAMRGKMSMWSENYDSLEEVFKNEKEWTFEQSATRDRRMMFHVACSTNAECGGTDACGPHHCSAAGECIAAAAPDLLPCGANGQGKCCGGVCQPDGVCAGACY